MIVCSVWYVVLNRLEMQHGKIMTREAQTAMQYTAGYFVMRHRSPSRGRNTNTPDTVTVAESYAIFTLTDDKAFVALANLRYIINVLSDNKKTFYHVLDDFSVLYFFSNAFLHLCSTLWSRPGEQSGDSICPGGQRPSTSGHAQFVAPLH